MFVKSSKISIWNLVLMFICRCFSDLDCDGYSFTMWLKLQELVLDETQRIVFSSGALGGTEVEFGGITLVIIFPDLKLNFKYNDPDKKWKVESAVNGSVNKWMHVAGTWTVGGAARLYIDGTLNDTDPGKTSAVSFSTILNPMHVGKKNSESEKYGHFILDEWYVWDKELSGDQVMQVYTAYQTGTSTIQCSSWYSLNNGIFKKPF